MRQKRIKKDRRDGFPASARRQSGGSIRCLVLPGGTHAASVLFSVSAGLFTAHAAGTGFRAVIGGDISAVVGICSVGINGRVAVSAAGEVQRTAVDRQVPVGVDAVAVRHDGDGAAVDGDEASFIRGEPVLLPKAEIHAGAVSSAGGVDAVVTGGDVQRAAVDGDRLAPTPS